MSSSTESVVQRLDELWATPKMLWGELTTVDHKKIGKRYRDRGQTRRRGLEPLTATPVHQGSPR